MRPLSLLLIAGCTAEDGAPADTLVEAGDTAADVALPDVEVDTLVAEWTAEEFGARLEALLARGPADPTLIATMYLDMMSRGDEQCPGSTTTLPDATIVGCTASTGYYYQGVCQYTDSTQGERDVDTWAMVAVDYHMMSPEGESSWGAGSASFQSLPSTDGRTFEAFIRGTFYDERADNWLGQRFGGGFYYSGFDQNGRRLLVMQGGLEMAGEHVYFDDLTWESNVCDGVATGAIHLYGDGAWYVWTLGDDCDTCGNVVYAGYQDLGEYCVDLTTFGEAAWTVMAHEVRVDEEVVEEEG